MNTRWLSVALLIFTVLIFCGCGGGSADDPETNVDVEAQAAAGDETTESDDTTEPMLLNGHYGGQPPQQPEGAIGMSRDYTFDGAAGTYEMTGYPSMAERGSFEIMRGEGGTRLLFSARRACGPCENGGPDEDAPDTSRDVAISEDGSSFTMDDWTFTRSDR